MTITKDELKKIIENLQLIYDRYDGDEIPTRCNTYGIYGDFVGTSGGYLDIDEIIENL